MYKKAELTEIESGLELINFTWFINSVRYDWTQNKAFVEIIMQEEGKTIKHSREFGFDCLEDWNAAKAETEILKLKEFSNSILL